MLQENTLARKLVTVTDLSTGHHTAPCTTVSPTFGLGQEPRWELSLRDTTSTSRHLISGKA